MKNEYYFLETFGFAAKVEDGKYLVDVLGMFSRNGEADYQFVANVGDKISVIVDGLVDALPRTSLLTQNNLKSHDYLSFAGEMVMYLGTSKPVVTKPTVCTLTGEHIASPGEWCFVIDSPYTSEQGDVKYVRTSDTGLKYKTRPSFDTGSIANTVTRLLTDGFYDVVKATPAQAGHVGTAPDAEVA